MFILRRGFYKEDENTLPTACFISTLFLLIHFNGGVQDRGGGQDDGQPEVYADVHGESLGPGRGHGLLVVTGKRRGRPRKGIVPDGLVQSKTLSKSLILGGGVAAKWRWGSGD